MVPAYSRVIMALTLPKMVAYIRAEIERGRISGRSYLEVLLEPLLQRVGDLVELIELPHLVSDHGVLYLRRLSTSIFRFQINRRFMFYGVFLLHSAFRRKK